jgi:glycosyltransferase involved in cell wall biosynthesis
MRRQRVTTPAPPRISVVISTLDRPQTLGRTLDALAGGRRSPDEVVVVDQGAPGPTGQVVETRRAAGLPVRHVVQQRRGLSVSQNEGIRQATGEVVAVVDDDCVPDPAWLEVVARTFTQSAPPLLVCGRILPLDPSGDRVKAVSSRTSTQRHRWSPDDRPRPMPWTLGSGGNFAVTRSACLAVGGNDERLGTGAGGRAANDVDLFDRLLRSGVAALYEPDLVVRHERSTIAEHRSRRRTYGHGVGALVGIRLRERRGRDAVEVLRGWLALRLDVARRRRREGGLRDELRVLLGTVEGLAFGLRAGPRTPSDSATEP